MSMSPRQPHNGEILFDYVIALVFILVTPVFRLLLFISLAPFFLFLIVNSICSLFKYYLSDVGLNPPPQSQHNEGVGA
ncbi:transmembrane protein, putative [Medicago truncatula]|uniref:Transmembrane protein, putative n=1 Tax=Medicago truncatula TaxID=3880 RepID=G7IP66_MEDTR|nr:transmembrane protein, putative [Medicago truncatula]